MLVESSFRDAAYKKHFHTEYSIALIIDGAVTFEVDGLEYTAKKGDIRIFNPYEVHLIKKSSWVHINISLEVQQLEGFRFKNLISDSGLRELFLQAYLTKRLPDDFKIRLKGYEKDGNQKENKGGFEGVFLYIEKNIDSDSPLKVEKLAEIYGASKFHFIRKFKEEFGVTPYEYVQILKIAKFRHSLREGNPLSISSLIAGFYDQSHLIKTYKKFFGHTPARISNIVL